MSLASFAPTATVPNVAAPNPNKPLMALPATPPARPSRLLARPLMALIRVSVRLALSKRKRLACFSAATSRFLASLKASRVSVYVLLISCALLLLAKIFINSTC